MENPEAGSDVAGVGQRGFWWILAGGWAAYFGLFASASLIDGDASGITLGMVFAAVLPPALLSLPVARYRRLLLRPEWHLGRTVLLHVAVALAYALGATLITLGSVAATQLLGFSDFGVTDVPPASWFLSALFLFALLDGFLMWTESVVRVAESRRIADREVALRAQAEAEAVRARFNPHFVFNTLHSLMLLVHAEPSAAERAIEDVASLIRYASTLQRLDVDLVPFHQEVAITRRYVALEALRLGDRLKVEWDQVAEVGALGLPPLSLQMLLENAIQHGISPRSEGGTVRVRAALKDHRFHVVVEDDGVGADPAGIRYSDRHSLGLLRGRIDALFGDRAEMIFRSEPGAGFAAELRLPETRPTPATLEATDGGPERPPR